MDDDKIRQIVRQELEEFIASDRYIFSRLVQFLDGRNVQVGKTTGTKIGTETTQKIAFHGSTPVVQAAAIANPSGGATEDTQARTAINSILTVLRNKGLIAS